MRTPDAPLLRVRTPTDLLAAVPYLLGFHPTDSVVLLGLRRRRLVFQVRGDLPAVLATGEEIGAVADHLVDVLVRQRVHQALIVGYGPADRVTRLVLAIRDRLATGDVEVTEILRATDRRYWSYLCESVECCPPEGKPFEITGSRIAAEATLAGRVALPDRATLERRLGPPHGTALEAIERVTSLAEQRLLARLNAAPDEDAAAEVLWVAGRRAVQAAAERHRSGGRLTDAEVAELALLLSAVRVRDLAWQRISPATAESDVRMWSDVVSRVRPDLAAPPAGLLAYAAWRAGDGAVAAIAVERALAVDASYSMALLMAEVLNHGIAPSIVDELPPRMPLPEPRGTRRRGAGPDRPRRIGSARRGRDGEG
jgi:hypothetical protein